MPRRSFPAIGLILMMSLSGCAMLRDGPPPAAASSESPAKATAEKAAEIATEPARDLGVAKLEIPPALVEATANPYGAVGDCAAIAAAIAALNEQLGPDYLMTGERDENKAGKLDEAGGKALVNSIIPFRGVVRELTGAAEAKRRYDDAVDAGYARRGFLRGLQSARACPPGA